MSQSRQINPLLKVIDLWLPEEKNGMRQMALLKSEEVLDMVVKWFNEVKHAEDKLTTAAGMPNKIFQDVIVKFNGCEEGQQNQCILLVCQLLITCLSLCDDPELQEAAGEVDFRSRKYGNIDEKMNSLSTYIDKVGIVELQRCVRELEKSDETILSSQQQKSKTKAKIQKIKEREKITFKKKSSVLDGHLKLLFFRLAKEQWIDGNEADFKHLFSGKNDSCEFLWLGKYGKGTLVYLFKELLKAGLISIPDGFTLSAILEGHFKDKAGTWITGLDKGDKPNDKAKPFIEESVKLLSTDLEDLMSQLQGESESFEEHYDPYDSELKLHNKHGNY
ncbi:MAG: hypothetical protein LIR46_08565 [Bacteroidota bacterium]|nr:hypothetical protein [Bacteroidota bacterium]